MGWLRSCGKQRSLVKYYCAKHEAPNQGTRITISGHVEDAIAEKSTENENTKKEKQAPEVFVYWQNLLSANGVLMWVRDRRGRMKELPNGEDAIRQENATG